MARLYYFDGDGNEQVVFLGGDKPEVLIGRQGECEIATMNSTVSRKHCVVRYEDGGFTAFDQGSSNGTFYKGEQANEFGLDDGDVFLCGNFEIRFELDPEDVLEDAVGGDEDEALEFVEEEGVDSEMIVESSSDTEMELGDDAAEVAAEIEEAEEADDVEEADEGVELDLSGGETLRDFDDAEDVAEAAEAVEELEVAEEIMEAEVLDDVAEIEEAEELEEIQEAEAVPEAAPATGGDAVDGTALADALHALQAMTAKVEALELRLSAVEAQGEPEGVDIRPLTEGLARMDAQLESNVSALSATSEAIDSLKASQSAQESALSEAVASMGGGDSATDALRNAAFWSAFGEVAASFEKLAAAAEEMRASMDGGDEAE